MSRTRMVAVAAPFSVAFVLLTMMTWGSRSSDLGRLESQAFDLEQQLMVQEGQLTRAEEFVAAGPAAMEELEAVRTAVPEQPELGSFVTANAEIAAAAGVEILSLIPEAAEGDSDDEGVPADVRRLGLDVTVRGEDTAIAKYLDALDGLPRLTVVEDVQMTAEGANNASASLGIAVFHY